MVTQRVAIQVRTLDRKRRLAGQANTNFNSAKNNNNGTIIRVLVASITAEKMPLKVLIIENRTVCMGLHLRVPPVYFKKNPIKTMKKTRIK